MAAFTATLVSKSPNADGRIVAIVSYSNGTTTVKRQYTFDSNSSLESLRAMVASELANVSATYDLYLALTPGPLNLTPPSPSAAEIAQAAWARDLLTVRQMQVGVALGIFDAADSTLAAAKARVIANYLPAYLDLLR
jgi:hypothetical protein